MSIESDCRGTSDCAKHSPENPRVSLIEAEVWRLADLRLLPHAWSFRHLNFISLHGRSGRMWSRHSTRQLHPHLSGTSDGMRNKSRRGTLMSSPGSFQLNQCHYAYRATSVQIPLPYHASPISLLVGWRVFGATAPEILQTPTGLVLFQYSKSPSPPAAPSFCANFQY